MNFESGSSLADFQDRLFKQYAAGEHAISKSDSKRLYENMWVPAARKMGPNNLVLRHWCLQALFNCTSKSITEITELFKVLTPGLYAEGYSYWLYTKPFLLAWSKEYYQAMGGWVKSVDKKFVETAYIGTHGLLYPAPFGDLRKEPLEDVLQKMGESEEVVEITPVSKKGQTYTISPYPLGGNTHVPVKKAVIKIRGTVPEGFKFYEGYDKKYSSGIEEFMDIIKPVRLFTMFR